MKAMVLAAGLGTRLKPLTDTMPKALVRVNGTPMLDIVMQKLIHAGFNEIIINIHHFAGLVKDHIRNSSYTGVRIELSDESDLLLDTGGAIQKARWFLEGNEPFLVHNVDVISAIDLGNMMQCHREGQSLATLAVSDRKSSRYFLFDDGLRLQGWENTSTGEKISCPGAPGKLKKLAFSGIHAVSPEIFQHLHRQGRFSIIPTYLELATSFPIHGYLHAPDTWFDLGKQDNLLRAGDFLRKPR